MSSDVAISVRGLGKSFRISHQEQQITLAEQVLERIRHPFRRAVAEEFWAFRDVEFDVHHGEVFGIIGRNGAGKSTLLKVLSRITPPTTGRIDVYGRIGSLLEVGTGFHPELTGRENVYLNGSILGMRRAEIDRQFDEIIDFAGVERFLDTPVKRYSSGMYVRLAFAVAAHLETEILVIDEVLAVGDAEFQERCIGKMRSASQSGRTVLLVSHNLPVIESLADRCAVLHSGTLQTASTDEALQIYGDLRAKAAEQPRGIRSDGPLHISSVQLRSKEQVRFGDILDLALEFEHLDRDAPYVAVIVRIHSDRGTPVATGFGLIAADEVRTGSAGGAVTMTVPLDGLAPGRYSVEVEAGAWHSPTQWEKHDWVPDAFGFEIQATSADSVMVHRSLPAYHGYLRLPHCELQPIKQD